MNRYKVIYAGTSQTVDAERLELNETCAILAIDAKEKDARPIAVAIFPLMTLHSVVMTERDIEGEKETDLLPFPAEEVYGGDDGINVYRIDTPVTDIP